MSEATLPRDAKEALELWDKGEEIAAFEVESQRCTQQEIYLVAFEYIRNGRMVQGTPEFPSVNMPTEIRAKINKREMDVAHSIAHVAMLNGWAPMVAQHLAGGHIKAISVKKP